MRYRQRATETNLSIPFDSFDWHALLFAEVDQFISDEIEDTFKSSPSCCFVGRHGGREEGRWKIDNDLNVDYVGPEPP